MSMNPRLWRVASYSRPGFPSPTISFIVGVGGRGSGVGVGEEGAFAILRPPAPGPWPLLLCGLALLYDFRLACCRNFGLFSSRSSFFSKSRSQDASDYLMLVRKHLDLRAIIDEVGDRHVVAYLQARYV